MRLGAKRLAGLGLVAVIALVVVLGVLKPNPFANKHTYWAVFDTAHGMGAIDRDVRIGGVRVGEVGRIERTGDNVRVELTLNQDYPLHTDARADMRPHTLFEGSNFVDVSPGSPGAPLLPEGHAIPLAQTSNYVTLDKALRVLRPEIRDDLQQLAKVGADTLQGQAVDGIQATLKNLPAMSKYLGPAARAAQGPHRTELVHGIHGLAQTVDALARQRGELIPLMRRLNRTAAALDVDGGAALDAALRELPGTLTALNRDAPALQLTVQRLSDFAGRLGVGAPRALADSLKALTPVIVDATPVLRSGTPIVHDARLVASRLAAAKGGLQTMFRVLAQPLKTFPETLDTLNAKTKYGASSGALQLVAGGFASGDGALSGYQTMAQNAAAPGHGLRADIRLDPGGASSLLQALTGGLPLLSGNLRDVASCAQVAKLSPRSVPYVRANGGCR